MPPKGRSTVRTFRVVLGELIVLESSEPFGSYRRRNLQVRGADKPQGDGLVRVLSRVIEEVNVQCFVVVFSG